MLNYSLSMTYSQSEPLATSASRDFYTGNSLDQETENSIYRNLSVTFLGDDEHITVVFL